MAKLGYSLSAEEFDAPTLVAQAERAERAGFAFAGISDHFHPWVDAQGESPFVWGVLGAIAARTERLELLTGVTCPTQRIHPAVVACSRPAVPRPPGTGWPRSHRSSDVADAEPTVPRAGALNRIQGVGTGSR
jgi:hypothetical protein